MDAMDATDILNLSTDLYLLHVLSTMDRKTTVSYTHLTLPTKRIV